MQIHIIPPSDFAGNFNLQDATLSYDEKRYSHSRQFRSNIADEDKYWENVMVHCGLSSAED